MQITGAGNARSMTSALVWKVRIHATCQRERVPGRPSLGTSFVQTKTQRSLVIVGAAALTCSAAQSSTLYQLQQSLSTSQRRQRSMLRRAQKTSALAFPIIIPVANLRVQLVVTMWALSSWSLLKAIQ